MLHIITTLDGRDVGDYDPHAHESVTEARECQDGYFEWLAESRAESAWLRAAEYSPRAADEDAREAAMFEALR